jgi:mono/diheme cytochrome c family protein
MNRILLVFGALGLGFILVAGAFFWLSKREQSTSLRPNDEIVVSQGEAVYRNHCAECHGQKLEGQPNWRSRDAEGYLPAPPHDASGHTWHHADELLFKITKFGTASIAGPDYKTRMPAYADVLSDEQIVAVLSFIKPRWPKEIQKRHDRMNQAASQKWRSFSAKESARALQCLAKTSVDPSFFTSRTS